MARPSISPGSAPYRELLEINRLITSSLDPCVVLETVAQNLVITSNLVIEPEVRVRVLLTSPLESFTVGHTIIISRGLIDVLPDEASLAMAIAHELSHIALDHQVIDTRFAFADRLMIPDNELLQVVQVKHTPAEELAADLSQIDMLRKSPYQEKLAAAGLFLRAVSANTRKLTNLIQPHAAQADVQENKADDDASSQKKPLPHRVRSAPLRATRQPDDTRKARQRQGGIGRAGLA